MALYPPAVQKPIAPGANDPKIKAIGLVLHVSDSTGSSLYDYFANASGGIESHFYIRYDGTVEQYRDTSIEADAQYRGNSWVAAGERVGLLSVETEGANHGTWTTAQVNAIKALIAWAARTHGFPLQVCPAWNAPGVGFHTMWGSPSEWTPVAKSCPGPDRIRQFREDITPWLKEAAAPQPPVNPTNTPTQTTPEDDMAGPILIECDDEPQPHHLYIWDGSRAPVYIASPRVVQRLSANGHKAEKWHRAEIDDLVKAYQVGTP